MKSILFIFLVLFSVNAVDLNNLEFAFIEKSIIELKQTEQGSFIVELAEFHSQMNGPLEDLTATIKQLIKELEDDIKRLDEENTSRTHGHSAAKQQLEDDIGTLQFQLAASNDNIDNLIVPNIDQTQKRIDQITANIKDNRNTLQRETLNRNNGHQAFLDIQNENSQAIEAIDECLGLLQGLVNGNVAFSEKATLHKSIANIKERINKHSEYGPIIETLMQLAQNFADQDQLKQIIKALNDLRTSFVNANLEAFNTEKDTQDEWVKRQKTINDDYSEFQNQIKQLTYNLVAYKNRLERETKYNQDKKAEIAALQEQLNMENDNFASYSGMYQELRALAVRDLTAARKALELLNQANFSDFMKQRMNEGALAGR